MPRTKAKKIVDQIPKQKRGAKPKTINEKLSKVMKAQPKGEDSDDELYDSEVINLEELKNTLKELKKNPVESESSSSEEEPKPKPKVHTSHKANRSSVPKKPISNTKDQDELIGLMKEMIRAERQEEKLAREKAAADEKERLEKVRGITQRQISKLRHSLNF